MTKEDLIKEWYDLFNNKLSKKVFKQSVFGSHNTPCDGWRSIDDKITLEKHPPGYLIYSKGNRFDLTNEEGTKMVKEFDEKE